MTDNEIIAEVAKLDGIPKSEILTLGNDGEQKHVYRVQPEVYPAKPLGTYLSSRDAIIPVIEKQNMRIKDTIAGILYTLQSRGEHQFLATPRQLCLALLKATGGER